jgi:multidrug efflux pump subunit AcrA (membrane-fusion protein)
MRGFFAFVRSFAGLLLISAFLVPACTVFVSGGCSRGPKSPGGAARGSPEFFPKTVPQRAGAHAGDPEEPLEFDLLKVAQHEVRRDIEGLGNLVIFDKATVLSRIDGMVESVFVKKGDRVRKGDLLLELTNRQLDLEKIKTEKDVLAAEEELETARMQHMEEEKSLHKKFYQIEKTELQILNCEKEIAFLREHRDRKRVLFEKGGITEEEFRNLEFSLDSKQRELAVLKKEHELEVYGFRDGDLAAEGYAVPPLEEDRRRLLVHMNTKLSRKRIEFTEIRLKKFQVELERVNWLLENRKIRSPIGGVVTEITKYAGEKVGADEAITTVLNQDALLARASFSESDFSELSPGETVRVFVDSQKKEVKGVVYAIDPYVDVKSRSFSIDCLLPASRGLVPGMFVRVQVPVQRTERLLLIPREAFIREGEGEGYVYILAKNDRIFRKTVRYEEYDDRSVVIHEGLREGDVIVGNPIMDLADGVRIAHGEI